MAEEFTTEQIETVLISIGHHLDYPSETPEFQEQSRGRTGQLLVAAAVLAVAVTGMVIVPSTRAAIADLLGIGSTRIEITGQEPIEEVRVPHIADGLTRISIDEATRILDGMLPNTSATALGPPEAVYQMPEGGVLLAWKDDTATLWIRAATDAEIVARKLIGSGENVESVDGLGAAALVITGDHLLQTPQRQLAAQQVLLWYDDNLEYRFEADIAQAELIAIARDLQ